MKLASVRFTVQAVAWGILLMTIPSTAPAQTVYAEDDPNSLIYKDLEELLTIEISVASKKSEPLYEAPGVVVVVPRSEFEIYGDRNLFQLMQRQPSIYARSSQVYSDNDASFRGNMPTHAGYHSLILFNGRPIRDSAQCINANTYMSFPLEALESVELIRGPGSVLYGTNAFSGVVNLKTRAVPEQPTLAVSGLAGSYGYYQTTVSGGGRFGELGFFGAARTTGQHGYRYRLTDFNGIDGSSRTNQKNVSGTAHLDYRGFTVDFFASEVDDFAMGVWPLWSGRNHEFRNKKMFVNAGYRVALHERLTLELNTTYNLVENTLTTSDPRLVGNNTSDLLGEVTLFADPLDNLNLILGYLIEYQTNYTPDSDFYQSIPSYHYKPQSAYAQCDYAFGKYLKLIAGGQWHRSGQGIQDITSRYGVVFTPIEHWGIKLLRGEAFRAPVAMETDLDDPMAVGNPDLKPEIITTYDAQLFYNDTNTYAAFTYFHNNIDEIIVYDFAATPMSYMNGGKHSFEGIELEAKRFLTPHWHVLGSYMHQKNDPDAGIAPSLVPEDMTKLGTGYDWDGGSVGLFYQHYSATPYLYPTLVPTEPEAVDLVSLNLRLDVSPWLQLKPGQATFTFKIENALNDADADSADLWGYYPYSPGILLYGGLTIQF
ncbi:MAG: TonB-dependent receptor [Sedimentisphaerales bacterium]|nr:TonB-dependent receptor [Sedimentisphaerales bacterium]